MIDVHFTFPFSFHIRWPGRGMNDIQMSYTVRQVDSICKYQWVVDDSATWAVSLNWTLQVNNPEIGVGRYRCQSLHLRNPWSPDGSWRRVSAGAKRRKFSSWCQSCVHHLVMVGSCDVKSTEHWAGWKWFRSPHTTSSEGELELYTMNQATI